MNRQTANETWGSNEYLPIENVLDIAKFYSAYVLGNEATVSKAGGFIKLVYNNLRGC